MKIAGLDIGTTGCKLTVFDEKGQEVGKAYKDYPIRRHVGNHELDVTNMMDAVYAVISELSSRFPDIAGIGVTSFGESFVMTDAEGIPLAPVMLYTDPRGEQECAQLVDALGAENIAEITGVTPHEMYGLAKMMWRKAHDPEIYAKTKHIFQMVDFVVFSLTGNAKIDYSLASRSMAFDIHTLTWSDEMLRTAGIDRELLSEPVPTGTDAGCVLPEIAEKTGLSSDTHIVVISHDQVAACIGAGAFDGSVALDGAGTVQCIAPIFEELPSVDHMMEGKYAIVPYAVHGKYVTYAFSYTGGALIQWCTDTLAKKEKELAAERNISVNQYLEELYEKEKRAEGLDPESPSGILVLPHFAGAATPYMDNGSRGAFLGLSMETTAAELYRACMEGVTYEMYLNYKRVTEAGASVLRLHATGGGARSARWMQMKADMLGLPITALKTVDAGTVGSAMMTGIAIGLFDGLSDAADRMIEKTHTYEPRARYHELYKKEYERYEKLYDAVRPLAER